MTHYRTPCSVLRCVAVEVCCSVLRYVAVLSVAYNDLSWDPLQCVAVYCSVLQCAAVCCSVLQCVAVCCSVLQCVVVCCSVLQCSQGRIMTYYRIPSR